MRVKVRVKGRPLSLLRIFRLSGCCVPFVPFVHPSHSCLDLFGGAEEFRGLFHRPLANAGVSVGVKVRFRIRIWIRIRIRVRFHLPSADVRV